MVIARSRITEEGQVSIPDAVIKKLGVGPGSVLEWKVEGDKLIVERSSRYSSTQIHDEIFSEVPVPKDLDELKEGVRRHIRHIADVRP